MNEPEIADLIDRFLNNASLYPQEWNDFVDTPQPEQRTDAYRKRCYELDPLVNRPGNQDPNSVAELKSMIDILRRKGTA